MAFIRDSPIPYAREPKQPMCRNSLMLGTSKNVRIRRVSDVAVWFRTDCDDDRVTAYRQSVEMSTLPGTSNGQFFYPCLRVVRFIPSRAVEPVGPPMTQFVSLKKVRIRIQFQKEYPKLVRELQRDTEIVALLKTESATNVCLQGLVLQLLWLSQRFKASEPLRCPSNRTLASPGCSRIPLHAASPISPSRNTVRPLSIRA